MRKVYRILFILHLFVGIGAMGGGLAAITNPLAPLGVPVEVLKNSPFSNFLMPGVILFTIIGLGNLACALLFRFKLKYQGYISSIFSWALVIFIIVQCLMINSVIFLHILFLIIGLIQASLSIIILFEKHLFPTNLVSNFIKK
jgi:hypothetical protein